MKTLHESILDDEKIIVASAENNMYYNKLHKIFQQFPADEDGDFLGKDVLPGDVVLFYQASCYNIGIVKHVTEKNHVNWLKIDGYHAFIPAFEVLKINKKYLKEFIKILSD